MQHACNKEKEIQEIHEVLDELKPLIPMLKEIVEEKKAMSLISKKVLTWVGVIVAVGMAIWTIIRDTRR